MTVICLDKIVLKPFLISIQGSKPLPLFFVLDLPIVEIILVDSLELFESHLLSFSG